MNNAHHIALMQAMPLDLPTDAGIPECVHLLPGGGTVHTDDRRGPYYVTSLQAIIAAASSVKLPIDENHSIDFAGPRGEPSPARGHIVELQARDDGLWGRVEWNASGRSLMEEKAYLGISPVITHDPAKNITGVLRASLTNRPNLRGPCEALRRDPLWAQVSASLYGANRKRCAGSLQAAALRNGWEGNAATGGFGGHFRAVQGFRYVE